MSDTSLEDLIPQLRPPQRRKVKNYVEALIEGSVVWRNPQSDVATEGFVDDFSDRFISHHQSSTGALSKFSFEYAMIGALVEDGRGVVKSPSGNRGADIVVDGEPWSLKTQADKAIKESHITISKFMELGKGEWDLEAQRERFFQHMKGYDRIFTLRRFAVLPAENDRKIHKYELVEIPKSLLLKASGQPIVVSENSRQNPKPASCWVYEGAKLLFQLYFDAGSERKLQILKLAKSECVIHATWDIKGE